MGTVIDIASLPLDNEIKLIPAEGDNPEYYAADNGIVQAKFYELGNRVIFESKGRSFAWTPDSMRYVDEDGIEDEIYTVQDVPLETKAHRARFNRSFPDVDDWFQVDNDRLKHTILLQGFQRDPLPWLSGNIDFVFGGRIEFDSDLRVMAHGLVITEAFETSEGIEIIDPDGNILFTLPQIVVYDSGIPDRAMNTGKYRVNSNDAGVLSFDIVVDNTWVSSTDRVYPIVIDPTVVVASAYDTSGNGARKEVNLSNGWLVTAVVDTVTVRLYKSTDGGTTWTQLCFISAFAMPGGGITSFGTRITAVGNSSSGQVVTFDAATVSNIDLSSTIVTIVVGTNNSGSSICTNQSNGNMTAAFSLKTATFPNSFNIFSAKSINAGVTWTKQDGTAGFDQVSTINTAGTDLTNPCVVIMSNGNPIIFSQFSNGTNYQIGANDYSGTAWRTSLSGMGRSVTGTLSFPASNPCAIVKQSGSNIGRIWDLWDGLDATDTTKRNVRASWSDDLGVTWNTAFKLTTGNTIDRQKLTLSENTNGDVYVFYQDSTAISYQICANGTTTFSGTTTFASAGTNPSAMERTANTMIGVVYMDASQVKHEKISFNVAPNAPTLTTEPNFDATATQTMNWTFSDPDVGNTQSAYQLIITKVSDGSTVLDTGKVVSSTASKSLTGSTLTNANQYQWKVRTWDQGDLVGPYSSLGSFYCSAKPTTTITVPVTDGTTVTTSSLTPNWTYSDPESEASTAYQVRLTTSADVVLYDSGKVSGVGVLALTIPFTLVNSTSYKVKITTWDGKDIASSEAFRTFTTSFTVPATPTITATSQTGYIAIAITNPTPAGAQPTITGNDLYRRETGTTTYVRIATGIVNNGTYNDYAVASGQSYDYYAQANGNNGTSINSVSASRSISFAGIWLHSVLNPSSTVRQFVNDGYGRSTTWEAEGETMLFSGRQKPVVEFGESAELRLSVSLLLEKSGTDYSSLQSLVFNRFTLCYRDGRGRKMFCVLTRLPNTEDFLGYQLDLEFIEIDYSEVL